MWHTLHRWNFLFLTVFLYCVQSFMQAWAQRTRQCNKTIVTVLYTSLSHCVEGNTVFSFLLKVKLNNHRQYIWDNPGRSFALSFSPCKILVASYRCLSELLSTSVPICSALRGVFFLFLTCNLFSPVPNPCWKSYSFLNSLADLFIFLMHPCRGKRGKFANVSPISCTSGCLSYPCLEQTFTCVYFSIFYIKPSCH